MSKTIHVTYTFHPARASDTVAWTFVPREAGGGLRPSPRPWESLSVCIKHQDMAAVVVRGFHFSCLALSLSLGIRPPCHKEAQTTGGSHLWVCIRHVFSSDALSPEALLSMAGGQGGLPLPDQIVNNAPVSSPFIANQSTWRPSLPSSIRLQATNLLPPSLQGQAPYGWGPPLCPEPAELTQPAPRPLALPHPLLRAETASVRAPRSVRLVTCPAASLGGPARHGTSFLLGTVRNKLSFQWQSSPDLVASPYLNDKQIYI